MNKIRIAQKTSQITLIISICGLVSELIVLVNSKITVFQYLAKYINQLLGSASLSFFRQGIIDLNNGSYFNLFNLAFHSVLLLGGVIYLRSDKGETRLLRFGFSILLLSGLLVSFSSLIGLLDFQSFLFRNEKIDVILYFINIPKLLGISWISHVILQDLNRTRILEENLSIEAGAFKGGMPASFSDRIFHLVADLLFAIALCSEHMGFFVLGWFRPIERAFGESVAVYLLAIVVRLFYYTFYEFNFGSTPAKFLTETRVVNSEGQRLSLKTSVRRTMLRFIPFEPFSFLSHGRWHDNWSNTDVVNEKPSGVPSVRYLLIIPLLLILAGLSWWGSSWYQKYKVTRALRSIHEEKVILIGKQLNELQEGDFIKVNNLENYSSMRTYLKIRAIKGDTVAVTIVMFDDDYNTPELLQAEKHVASKLNTADYNTRRTLLEKANLRDFEQRKTGIPLFGAYHGMYEIEQIARLYSPKIQTSGSSRRGDLLSISISNDGWPGYLVEIKKIKGNLGLNQRLPMRVESGKYSFSFDAVNYQRWQRYEFQFVVADSLNRRRTYLMEVGSSEKLTEIFP